MMLRRYRLAWLSMIAINVVLHMLSTNYSLNLTDTIATKFETSTEILRAKASHHQLFTSCCDSCWLHSRCWPKQCPWHAPKFSPSSVAMSSIHAYQATAANACRSPLLALRLAQPWGC